MIASLVNSQSFGASPVHARAQVQCPETAWACNNPEGVLETLQSAPEGPEQGSPGLPEE